MSREPAGAGMGGAAAAAVAVALAAAVVAGAAASGGSLADLGGATREIDSVPGTCWRRR